MIKSLILSLVVSSMFTIPAMAIDEPGDLDEWVNQARIAILDKMHFPENERYLGNIGTNTFIVTIDREGAVQNYTAATSSKRSLFNSASKRALKYVNFPSVPNDYAGDKLKFRLVMDYINKPSDAIRLHPRGTIKGTQITLILSDSHLSAK